MSYGQKSNVGLIFQNSYGTAGSVNSIHFIPHLSESLKINKPPMYSENMRGIYDEGDSYEGANTVDGSIECEVQPISIGALLKSVMNLESSTQSGGIYTHLFKPRTADFDELCAGNPVTAYVYRDTGSAMLYSDLNGSVLELGYANGEFNMARVDYVGGTFSQNASQAASYEVGKRFKFDVNSVSFGGTAVDEVEDLTITLDESLEASHTLNNSLYPSRIKRTGMRSVSIGGTLKFDNQDEYQQFILQSERELIITATGPTEIQSGFYEVLTVKLPAMRYEEAAPNAGGPGELLMSITARGKYDVSSATSIEITVVNTQATY